MKRLINLALIIALLAVCAQATTFNAKTDCGAVGDGVANDTSAINACIGLLGSGDTLLFPAGTYKVTSQITNNKSNYTIDGSSNTATIKMSGAPTNFFVIGNNGTGNAPSVGSAVALSSTANEGATSFATVSSLGVSAGDYIFLKQGGVDSSNGSSATQCDPSGCRGQVTKVVSTGGGNTVNTADPLVDTFSPSINGATATKINTPVTNITVQNITFDGSGGPNTGPTYGLVMPGVVNSTLSGVTAKNVQGAAFLFQGGYNNNYLNITITGAGSAACGGAVNLLMQARLFINTMALSSLNPGAPGTGCLNNGAFGFLAGGSSSSVTVSNSTILNLSIDSTGTGGGRPFKLDAARYNVFYNLSVTNGCCAFNGMAPEYYSSHNAFVSCTVTNNGGAGTGNGNAGVNSFGNYNTYNTYSDCTVTGNGNVQWFISNFDFLTQGNDSFNTLNRGTYTGSNGVNPPLYVAGANPYITGALINGSGPQGLLLTGPAANGCINNNTFSGSLTNAISSNSSSNVGTGNTLNGKSSNLQAGSCTPGVPTFSPSPSSLSFGSVAVGTPSSLPITVTNNGTGGYNLTSYLYIAGANPGDFTETDNCHAVLASNTCNITVTFTPQASGARSATVSTYDNTLNATNSITLTGNGGSVVVNPPAPSPGFMLSDLVPGSLR